MDYWWLLVVPGIYPLGLIAWFVWRVALRHWRIHRRLRRGGAIGPIQLVCPECIEERQWSRVTADQWLARNALRKRLNREEFDD